MSKAKQPQQNANKIERVTQKPQNSSLDRIQDIWQQSVYANRLGSLFNPAENDAIQTQAARLRDSRFLTAQRQSMAVRVGQVGGNQHLQRMMAHLKQPDNSGGAPSSQTTIQREKENEEILAPIQGHAMFALLPRLQALSPEVLNDDEAGYHVGGPRLVTAMRVVKAKGTPWLEFAAAHNGELAQLPGDQITDIMNFLGAPKKARYMKGDQFGGLFDGAVDPGKGELVLFFRVKFEVEDAKFKESTEAGLKKFKAEFKQRVESTWKGQVKPAQPIGKLAALQARVEVVVVESGEHAKFILVDLKGEAARFYHHDELPEDLKSQTKTGYGLLGVDANEMQTTDKNCPVMDDQGRPAGTVTNKQATSAHEFGHAIGVDHPRHGSHNDACSPAYGITAKERESIMGAGHKMTVVKRKGKIVHNTFQPFLDIATRWGQDVFPAALAKHNKWSAG